MADEPGSGVRPDRDDPMQRISARLSDSDRSNMISTGDHATLRRMYLTNKTSAVGVTVKLLLEAGVETWLFESDWEAWKLVVHVAALISGTGRLQSYSSWRGFGTALREAQPSEQSSDRRLLTLTAAKGQALKDQVTVATRQIIKAEKKGPINLWNVLHLVGSSVKNSEAARFQVARDYYVADAKVKRGIAP